MREGMNEGLKLRKPEGKDRTGLDRWRERGATSRGARVFPT